MASSMVIFGTVFQLMFMLMSTCIAQDGSSARFFDVTKYGAVGNGKTDNSNQFKSAWNDACQYNGNSVMYIPRGIYKLNPIVLNGPCKGAIAVKIVGDLKASSDYSSRSWIDFRHIDQLLVEGGGTVDGQGASAWNRNSCQHKKYCDPLPLSMVFNFVTNSKIVNLRMINGKSSHMKLFACKNVVVSGIKITAPENSPNTDGINIAESQNIIVRDSTIACGDDCISLLSGTHDVEISNVYCGPGHGISVGSIGKILGKGRSNSVSGVHVRNCSLTGTTNGLRIKTWAPSDPGVVSDFVYENIRIDNADNPIIIDQHYCPSHNCNEQEQSSIKINNVTFSNIWGQSSSATALNIQCSSKLPCTDVKLHDINLVYNGRGGQAKVECSNVHGQSYGREQPAGCF